MSRSRDSFGRVESWQRALWHLGSGRYCLAQFGDAQGGYWGMSPKGVGGCFNYVPQEVLDELMERGFLFGGPNCDYALTWEGQRAAAAEYYHLPYLPEKAR